MIHEISQFIDHLEKNNQDIFSERFFLKEGFYAFVEKEGDELVIKDKNVLKVDNKTEKNNMYNPFLERYINSEMLNAMKSFNSGPKVFIAIGSPFGIALSGKAYKGNARGKLKNAADAYFKAAQKYIDSENEHHVIWYKQFKLFVETKMFDFLESNEQFKKVKDDYLICFFHNEPTIEDFKEIHSCFLSEKLYNKDKFNVKSQNGEVYGISDNLSGFNDSKVFLKHQTAPVELNYRVNGDEVLKLYKFFRLQQKNKILPNPMPIFVDEKELTEKAVNFYKSDTKKGHKEIIEHLLEDRKEDLHNYYLIFFKYIPKDKKEKIYDLDFVPVFKYKLDDKKKIDPIFNTKNNKINTISLDNIFDLENEFNNKIFLQFPKKSNNGYGILKSNYFTDKIEPYKGYFITEVTLNLIYKYRKAIYDFIYKSKRHAINGLMFNDIMLNSVLDDIHHDEFKMDRIYHTKEVNIKEKLNIWFSLYNYFNHDKNKENMANNIKKHREMVNEVANGKRDIIEDDEYAFVSGQVIYYLLSKSKSSDKSYSNLEPFLQKSNYKEFRKALSTTFNTYKHELYSKKFKNPYANVLDYEPTLNFKDLIPILLAGFFSECVLFSEQEKV